MHLTLKMKIGLLGLLLSGGVQAASIVVDFEEFSPIPSTPVPVLESFVSQGVLIDLSLAPSGVNIFADNSLSGTGNEIGFCGFCSTNAEGISLSLAAGGVFKLDSIDLRYNAGTGTPGASGQTGTVIGYLSGGGTLEQAIGPGPAIVTFDGAWSGLNSIDIVFDTSSFSFSTPSLDNITLQAVPVPAAAWLFGSALAGLGWLRRKQAV